MFLQHPNLGHSERKKFAPKKLMKLAVSHPYETWAHQFLSNQVSKLYFAIDKKIYKSHTKA